MVQNKYKIITTQAGIDELIGFIKKTRYCALDFETSGGSFANHLEYPTIIGSSFQVGSSYIIPLGHFDSPFKNKYEQILAQLDREIFRNEDIVKIAWNMKFEHKWLLRYGCDFKGRCFDGMLAKYLLDEERPNGLGDMVARILPEFEGYKDDTEILAQKYGWAGIPLKELCDRNALDTDLTLRLMLYFEQQLIKTGLYPLFRNMWMPASRVLAESEFYGLPVDVKYLDKLIVEFRDKIDVNEGDLRKHRALRLFEKGKNKRAIKTLIDKVKNEIDEIEESGKANAEKLIRTREEKISRYLAGEVTTNKDKKLLEPFNFNSPQQLTQLLYTDKSGFGFPIMDYTKDKFKQDTSNPSTAEETLEKIRHLDKSGFIDQLLTHRELSKMYSTYMVGMRKLITEDNRIHANFNLHGTVTQRLSCVAPNLQQIPRGDTDIAATIKKMFIAPPGKMILQLDYAQAELRIMAEMANETSMLEWFRDGKDIHLASACKKYNYDYDKALAILSDEKHKDYKLWKKRRKQAKTINFGIIFCQMAKKLAVSLSEPAKWEKGKLITPAIVVEKDTAQEFLNDFDSDFPRVNKFIKSQKALALKNGYVKNMFGGKRRLPNIYSSEFGIKAEAERQSVNSPVQGTASLFALFSSILIREYLIKHGLKEKWGMNQLYTVHDSIGYDIYPKYVHEAVKVLNHICENPPTQQWFGFKLKHVQLKVDFETESNWGKLLKYNKETNYEKEYATHTKGSNRK